MENALANSDYNDIMMQLRAELSYKNVESKINANLEKFNSIAKLYEDI